MKTVIYLIRHAEAEGNLCRRIHGHYDSNLTVKGLQQLRQLRDRFSRISVDACYSSDLTRAANTAQAVCQPNGLQNRTDSRFREVGVGIWEDRSFGYLTAFCGKQLQEFRGDRTSWAVEGSETHPQYTVRFLEAMEQAACENAGGAIAIVTHSMVLNSVLALLFPELSAPHCANTAVTCIEYEDGVYSPVWINDYSHLGPEHSAHSYRVLHTEAGPQGNDVLWFRPGWTELGLTAPEEGRAYTVLEGQTPVGLMVLSEEADCGRVKFLGLIPAYRGYGLSIQLLGKAISVFRMEGRTSLCIHPGGAAAIEAMCGKLPFEKKKNGDLVLNLRPRIQCF